jgi:hypothetical protein
MRVEAMREPRSLLRHQGGIFHLRLQRGLDWALLQRQYQRMRQRALQEWRQMHRPRGRLFMRVSTWLDW